MSETSYDVIIVGAGVAGALIAKRLTDAGKSVLMLEAGDGTAQSVEGYQQHVNHYLEAGTKNVASPWPDSPFAPHPEGTDDYYVQKGPQTWGSSYTRLRGGSTLHWLGVSLRMVPQDFHIHSECGVGRDWPLEYEQLVDDYADAERELGVAANVEDQTYHCITFPDEYNYPMERVPPSYSDKWLDAAVSGFEFNLGDGPGHVRIRNYPAARNSTPRGDYIVRGATDRRVRGVSTQPEIGERCQGNTSCIPICPVQAKYNAGRTLGRIDGSLFEVRHKCVATKINVSGADGEVSSIHYKRWEGGVVSEAVATAKAYVLAAHAIENAKILLMSGITGPKSEGHPHGLVGTHLMDHPALYAWGLAPKNIGAFRGPQSTAGIEDMRSGAFRKDHAAFRYDVGNNGWAATMGSPNHDVITQVDAGVVGHELRAKLADTVSRQIRLSLAIEQMPDPANRITLSANFKDALGLPRPEIHYRIDEYTRKGMAACMDVTRRMFEHADIEDHTGDGKGKGGFHEVRHGDTTFYYHGMGHLAGTHAMGTSADDSVVDVNQRCWLHPNLYLVGAGSMPTMGTSNPTLTLAALAIRTARHLVEELPAS